MPSDKMPKKIMSRNTSMVLPGSFGRCFGAGDPLAFGFLDDTEVGFYDKIGSEEVVEAEEEEAEQPRPTQIGPSASRAGREAPRRTLSIPSILRGTKGGLGSRMKGACGQVLDVARKSRPHLNQLFVGNQLLTHVTSSSLARSEKAMKPSTGFVDNSIRTVDMPMRER